MCPADLVYPSTRRVDVVDTLHGIEIADPYRWLEDPDSPDTAAWIDQQNEVTSAFLATQQNTRPRFQAAIEKLLDYDRYSAPAKKGKYVYYTVQKGLANQPVLMRADSLTAETAVTFIDPNTIKEDGTASLADTEFSPQGKYCAYSVSLSGSDWTEIHIRDTETIEDLGESLEWAKFSSVAWNSDETGFWYSRYPAPESLADCDDKEKRGAETDEARNQAIYYHVLGTPQEADRLVFTDPEFPKRIYGLQSTRDGAYLIVTHSEDCAPRNQMWIIDVRANFGNERDNIVRLVDTSFDAEFTYIANDDSVFYLLTNWKAQNNRIIAADLSKPSAEWTEVVPEHPAHVLATARAAQTDRMALVYMEDVKDRLSIHALRTGELLHTVTLPDIGSVSSIRASRSHEYLTYVFSSFLYPGTVYYIDLNLPFGDGTRVFRSMTPPGFDPAQYSTRQVFYESKDGTRIPMFIVGPREGSAAAKQARPNPPTLLYGYGGFSIPLTPYYSARWASWLQLLHGVVVVANLRGGNEYGEDWHNQGIIGKKQNVFDDFQWAAKALTGELKVTTPESVLIMGGSNGGLLVGACINQAPELFGAAIAQVGVMDMLRFHKFTIGSAWVSDYGDPDKEEEFQHIIKYSPLHNVSTQTSRGVPYPAVMLTTGDHDDRVVPLHTLKFGATLQHVAGKSELQKDKPLLLRVDTKRGMEPGNLRRKL